MDANSYLLETEADTYFDEHLYPENWAGASTEKPTALVMATRWMDAMWRWSGYPTDSTTPQALQWPRNGVIDSDEINFVPSDVIPDELKWATAELAGQLLGGNRTADSDTETQGITKIKAGSVELNFKSMVTAKVVPDAVINLIPKWWGYVQGKSTGTRPLVRA